MNKKNRTSIRYAINTLYSALSEIERCRDDEEDSMYNLSGTALENTEMYEKIEESYNYMEDAISDIESGIDQLTNIL